MANAEYRFCRVVKITCAVITVLSVFIFCSCNKYTPPEPVTDREYTVDFDFNDTNVTGKLNYTNSKNYTFVYSAPESIKGFTVSLMGGKCSMSFLGIKNTASDTPFTESSPVGAVIDAFKLLEGDGATMTKHGDGKCVYSVSDEKRGYTIECDDVTGEITSVISDAGEVRLSLG